MSLVIDGSSPAWVSTVGVLTTLTTGTFTPPANSLLVVFYGMAHAVVMNKPTSTIPGVTFAAAVASAVQGITTTAAVWLGQVGATGTGTVTVTNAGQSTWGIGCAVVTGALGLAAQTGTTGNAQATGAPSVTLASLTGNNSLVLGAGVASSGTGIPAPGPNQSQIFAGKTYNSSSGTTSAWAQRYGSADFLAGSSVTINNPGVNISFSLAVAEILAAPTSGSVLSYGQYARRVNR